MDSLNSSSEYPSAVQKYRSSDTRRLIIMRHSKASYPLDVSDFERPLAQRGHNEAPIAGQWLLQNDVVPDFILCSSALRTRQTCTWICDSLGALAPTPYLEDALYNATDSAILSCINAMPDTIRTLMVIAHLPGVQDLGMRLAARDSDAQAYMSMATGYPTSAMAIYSIDKPWAVLDGADAQLNDFVGP